MSLQAISQKVGSIATRKRQKGASALEYLVLAAAIIIIIGALSQSDTVTTAVDGAFEALFQDASDTTPPAG